MTVMLVLLAALAALGLGTALLNRFLSASDADESPAVARENCGTCDGSDTKCEQECMLEAAVRDIEYYDDEELDRFRGRRSDSYDDDEAEEFRDVLYSMPPEDVAGWNRSLVLREVNIPDQVKDELLLLLSPDK